MTAPPIPILPLALVVNPTAGRGAAARALPAITALLAQRSARPPRVYITECKGDGKRLARQAMLEGAEIVAAVGGDGTLHEVANTLLDAPPASRPTLALIPFGTGNDFARAVGLRGTLPQIIDVIAGGCRRMIDVGLIESPSFPAAKSFLVAAGIGFVADTAHTVNTQVKFLTGPAAYVYGAFKTLGRFKPVKANLTFDNGAPQDASLTLVSVSNVATTGGGIQIAPGAEPDDGYLDVCLVGDLSKFQLITKLPAAFSGRHISDSKVTMVRCSSLRIETATPCSLWIDGEVTGSTPAVFSIEPSALSMLLPPVKAPLSAG